MGVDRDGWVYVADRENHRIQVFSPEGKFEAQWINMSRAACLYLDTKGGQELIYVGEYFSGINPNRMGTQLGPRVSIYDTKGNRIARLGTQTYGDEPGRFYSPHGIAVDSKGRHLCCRGVIRGLRQQDGPAAGTALHAEAGQAELA